MGRKEQLVLSVCLIHMMLTFLTSQNSSSLDQRVARVCSIGTTVCTVRYKKLLSAAAYTFQYLLKVSHSQFI